MNGNSCWATSCWLTLHVTSDVSVGWQKWLVFSVYQFFWLFLCKATNSLQVEDFKYLKENMADYIESKPLITLLKCCFYISHSILIVWLVWWFWEIFLYLWEGWYVWIIYSFNVSTNVLHIFFILIVLWSKKYIIQSCLVLDSTWKMLDVFQRKLWEVCCLHFQLGLETIQNCQQEKQHPDWNSDHSFICPVLWLWILPSPKESKINLYLSPYNW